MKNLFNSIKLTRPKSNVFDLTHDVKFSAQMGNLIPVMQMECVPGDRVTLGADALVRFAPLIAPVMHRMNTTIHYFFCPNRLVFPDWEKFITQREVVAAPFVTIDGGETAAQQRFLDYMGIPPNLTGGAQSEEINAIPLAAYQKIYQEYYRDQNLITEVVIELNAGDNTPQLGVLCEMKKRAWMHDYFTSCLPWAQKGAAVDLPLGVVELQDPFTGSPFFQESGGAVSTGNLEQGGIPLPTHIEVGAVSTATQAYNPDGTLVVGATTVNDLRRAYKLQEWLERMARGGSRYIEQTLVMFGIKSSDARLQRPEYITGIKAPVIISEVLNTTGEASGLPQGNMAGHAVSVPTGNVGSYFCEEHGWIMGIMSVTPIPAYQQGIHKSLLKREPLDYFWPSFANIGEQEVLVKEVFAYDATSNDVFGYIPRYSEYKYMPNRVAAEFRTSLDYWHLGRIFATAPTLSQEFIEVDPADVERIFAVVSGVDDNLYIEVLNKVKARRLMPQYGTPMI